MLRNILIYQYTETVDSKWQPNVFKKIKFLTENLQGLDIRYATLY